MKNLLLHSNTELLLEKKLIFGHLMWAVAHYWKLLNTIKKAP